MYDGYYVTLGGVVAFVVAFAAMLVAGIFATYGLACWTMRCQREHASDLEAEVPPDEVMDQLGARDHSRPARGPRAFAPGRHAIAHLREPLESPTTVMTRVDEAVHR